ncbi:hypothetical protein Tchar_00965 [Tepidimonas charontis]|uniref:Transposase InsH N-terminal domain-containing protein n=1 Tax=Tepidimonas charontis TaxID=2267262 RepID=A0A554XGS9_9BURK|nr:hypothetical protein Tchar_00965 [Tepidimonas charontis]
MFSYISLEERVPQTHPLRKLRAAVVALLATMNREFDAVYARRGRPSVPPGMLDALLLQILFSIRSERQLVEAIEYNLLYRWFVGLNIEDKVWGHCPFSAPTASGSSTKTWPAPFSSGSSTHRRLGKLEQRRTLQCGWHADRGLGLTQKFQGQAVPRAPALEQHMQLGCLALPRLDYRSITPSRGGAAGRRCAALGRERHGTTPTPADCPRFPGSRAGSARRWRAAACRRRGRQPLRTPHRHRR